MNDGFQPPPKVGSLLATVGGVVTAIAVIAGLEVLSNAFPKTASSASTTPKPESVRSLQQTIERQAVACRFDQSRAPDRGMTFARKTFYSRAMQQTRTYGLVLPPGYEQNPQKLYPVIFLLHGGHGDTSGWQSCGALTEILHQLYTEDKLPAAIVITPDGNDRRGSSAQWDPDYLDGPHGQVATLIGSDLVQEVKSHYRVLQNPDFWALGGLSSGGWGAFNIGLRYLDQFHILFSHSGYFTDNSGFANSPAQFIQQIPAEKLRSVKAYLDAGAVDAQFLNSTEQFHKVLQQLGVEHEFHMFTGGHGTIGRDSGWYYWQEHLLDALKYIGKQWIGYNDDAAPTIADIASLDAQSLQPLNTSIKPKQLIVQPQTTANMKPLSSSEFAMARQAWQYFQHNWNSTTGFVNAADGFASVTLWDQATAIAALVSAKEFDLVPTEEFKSKLGQILQTLATLPLYNNELPNKVYNAKTLIPVGYGQLDQRQEIGWSALDLGRLSLWLKIIASRYPEFRTQAAAVWQHWQVGRLVKNGQLYGTTIVRGKEQYNQEGRLGYESYAAYGLSLWGLDVKQALDTQAHVAFTHLYGQAVPYDRRDYKTSGANNYVLSEPYILDGIETGFQSLPKSYADQVLAAQTARYQATKKLTALSEDNLDRSPYFVYNTLFANGMGWATITDTRLQRNDLRFLSAKAAIGWQVLYNTNYTRQLFDFVQTNLKAKAGWYSGFYESLDQPNQALTANNNGVILESLLYQKVGQPLTQWAGMPATTRHHSGS